MAGLILNAVEVADDQWHWQLTDDSGVVLAEHSAVLEGPEAEAFADLYHYLRRNADPDRRSKSEASIVERLGEWVGARVLGADICSALAATAPISVRVRVPDSLLSCPLELAHIGGVPLAQRGDISLVYDVGSSSPAAAQCDRLRMVAVFSLPTETSALGLRRERYELTRLVRALAARSRRAVQLEVLQYGVTREELVDCMTRDGGPDILHLSGHGRSGLVLLEKHDGQPDHVTTDELLSLLRPARGRLRLAVLSACESAAAVTAETLRLLALDEAAEQVQAVADAEMASAPLQAGIARRVAQELGCAVVAMRYPVDDDFAIALARSLYDGLFSHGLPLDAALRRAMPLASTGSPAISIATPTLVGTRAIGMSLTPPRGEPVLAELRLPGFPDEPVRFVGRAAAMARGSRALAPGSGQSGVLFHGMAGAGKTSCAVELAYRHRFAHAVWWQAPTRDEEEWPLALTQFAQACEAHIPGFAMVDKLTPPQAFQHFLPRLRTLLRDNGLFIVLDNLETLLTDAGEWRDPRWGQLVEVLTGHGGESRVVLTSRVRPAGLSASVQVEPVHALSRDEAMLMARELPNLSRLLRPDPGPERSEVERARATVRRILHLVQGHPKLLELADAAAADPETLAAHLTTEHDEHTLTAFFTRGESTLDADGFLSTLASWTHTTMATLPPASQLMLQMLAGMEDNDRHHVVLEDNWADLCQRLEVEPTQPGGTLAPLIAAALVDRTGTHLRLHPGIAETIRTTTPVPVREAIDTELGEFWEAVAWQARQRDGGEHTPAIVRAGLAAAPYLLRQHQWDTAATLIEQALNRDETVAVAQLAAGHLRRITDATSAPVHLAKLGAATVRLDPAAGEQQLLTALDQATIAGDYRLAAGIAADLISLCRRSGRLAQALALVDRKAEYTRRAGLGPWTRLTDQAQRLQILYLQGQHEHVLSEVGRLAEQMAQLPDPPADNEITRVWNVRESILNLGTLTAQNLGRWQEALVFNAANLDSKRTRGAGAHAIASARFNDYGSLVRLGRLDQAEQLLLGCQQTFDEHHDILSVAKTFSARADLADERGHHRHAITLECTALRLLYTGPNPGAIGGSHHNLAIYLRRAGTDPAARLGHRLAAATIAALAGQDGRLESRALAADMRQLSDTTPPATIAELATIVERLEGVKFTELITVLAGDLDTAQQALDAVLRAARDDVLPSVQEWEPVLLALVAAVGGDAGAAQKLDELFNRLADSDDWAALVAMLRRIVAGERDADQLTAGLDAIEAAIVTRALEALTPPTTEESS